jgi:hypothetical protein
MEFLLAIRLSGKPSQKLLSSTPPQKRRSKFGREGLFLRQNIEIMIVYATSRSVDTRCEQCEEPDKE